MRQKSRTINIPLFWKFAIRSTIIVAIFGAINIYLLWTSVYKPFEKEIDKRCKVLAKIVSDKSLTPMVYEDYVSLYNILDEIKQSDPSISYIFILNNTNKLVAQTYDIDIPEGLLEANNLVKGALNIKVIKADNYKYSVIRDIAYPILNGEVGTVRLGIVEEHIQQEIINATTNLLIMIVVFLIVGLVGALFFSYLITSPIKKISQKAQIIDLNYFLTEDYNIDERKKSNFLNIHVDDEMDVLVTKFSDMINRLRHSYIELKDAQDALIQAEKLTSLGTLSAGVAHEINNPISGIKNCTNRIIKNPDKTEQNLKYIHLIKDATNKIELVVQRLLRFSRKQDIVFEEVHLNSVFDSAIILTSHKFKSSKISINTNYKTGFYVKGSTNHLEQVFVNLLLNSLDAINEKRESKPDFEGVINIDVIQVHDKVYIHFKDNGNGIDDIIKDKIFDPFFTSKKVGKGTGLGLSVSFNLINDHGGSIKLGNSSKKGTEFIIELETYTQK